MLLLIEIILTIFVWRNGWKWYSLIPVGVTFLIGMIVGVAQGLSGNYDVSSIFIFDIFAIIALIVMLVKKPKPEIKKNF